MKYALERLEDLITQFNKPALYKGQPLKEHELPAWSESITIEIKNVKLYLRRRAYDIRNERSFELLIHQYQKVIIDLLDKVYAYEKESDNSVLALAYQLMLDHLTELLSIITKSFSLYFNKDERVPKLYLQLSKNELKEHLPELQKRLREKFFNEEIIKISLGPIIVFIKSNVREISYTKLLYLQEVCKQLDELSGSAPIARMEADKELIELLVYMNLNSSEFINYLLNDIINSINQLDGQMLKIEKLNFYLKDIKQMQEKPGIALNVNATSVKDQVTDWINEEIFYLETKSRLLSVMPVTTSETSISDNEKLILSASVAVLGLLARAGKDSKFILNKHSTEVFKNISKFCRTPRTESPEIKSMSNKSYAAERSNKLAAVNILHEMIKWIHKYCIIPFIVYHPVFNDAVDLFVEA